MNDIETAEEFLKKMQELMLAMHTENEDKAVQDFYLSLTDTEEDFIEHLAYRMPKRIMK